MLQKFQSENVVCNLEIKVNSLKIQFIQHKFECDAIQVKIVRKDKMYLSDKVPFSFSGQSIEIKSLFKIPLTLFFNQKEKKYIEKIIEFKLLTYHKSSPSKVRFETEIDLAQFLNRNSFELNNFELMFKNGNDQCILQCDLKFVFEDSLSQFLESAPKNN